MVTQNRWFLALLSAVVLSAVVLLGAGCEQPPSLVTEDTSPGATSRAEPADSEPATDFDAKSSEEEGEEAVELEGVVPLKVGDKAPDFEIEAMGGSTLRLTRYLDQTNGPTVLLFDRAHW